MKKKFLDLGTQPITNAYLTKESPDKEYLYNLSIAFDEETKLVSLVDMVKPEMMFNDSYAHRASMSKTMLASFKKIAESLKARFNPKLTLEIGSNDGVFIRNFNVDEVIAVEPCGNLAELTNKMGYKTYTDFWDQKTAEQIVNSYGKVDVVFSANTICHIEDLNELINAIDLVLDDKGVFVFEDPSLYSVLQNTSYDQFYDEHVYVLSVIALQNIFKKHGLEIFHVESLLTHGGSNRIYVKKIYNKSQSVLSSVDENIKKELSFGMDSIFTYEQFADRVIKSKNDLIDLLIKIKNENKKIISYGATYKSTTIFNYCKIGKDLIEYIVDTTPNKQGKFSPGMHIPIISPEEGFNNSVDYAFLGAWNFGKEIINKEHDYINRGGKFITHVPHVRVL